MQGGAQLRVIENLEVDCLPADNDRARVTRPRAGLNDLGSNYKSVL
jgi:hypothetical protein